MQRAIITGLALGLGACIAGGGEVPAPAPLAQDREQPALALLEHVLTGYFAAFGANPPTTCAAIRPGPLSPEQEKELISRFVRLAPASRCAAAAGGTVDGITGERAGVVELYQFACQGPEQCAGWVTAPGAPATRYAMRFENGEWRFTSDRRLIAE